MIHNNWQSQLSVLNEGKLFYFHLPTKRLVRFNKQSQKWEIAMASGKLFPFLFDKPELAMTVAEHLDETVKKT